MKLFLACSDSDFKEVNLRESMYSLMSFYYIQKLTKNNQQRFPIEQLNEFLLDSGAFTYMNGKTSTVEEIEKYLDDYIRFINEYDIKLFFELDMDAIFGYNQVLKWRKKLEEQTGKKCIPVWHKSRGKEEFIKMCQEYDYAAIGGIVTKEITKKEWKHFSNLNALANQYGCRLHGLGFTPNIASELISYGFYSSDSSSWTMAERFPQFHIWQDNRIKNRPDILKDRRKKISTRKSLINHQFREWLKYQKFLQNYTGGKK